MNRLLHLLKALAALALMLLLLIGVPAVLIATVGWPLPTVWPSLDQLREFPRVGVADATVVKTLAVVVWLAWVQVAVAIVVETVAYARRRTPSTLRVLPGLQQLAANLVATVALVAAVTSSTKVGMASAMPIDLAVATAPINVTPSVELERDRGQSSQATPEVVASTMEITTSARDSWWKLADDHLGDGIRWRELRQLNLGRTVAPGTVIDESTDQLEPGWALLVPAGPEDDTSRGGPPSVSSPVREVPAHVAESVVVDPGDHFWSIAEDTLTDAWARTPTDAETTSYWQRLVEDNRDRLVPPGDPDLIHPGQEFQLPAIPPDPAVGAAPADQPPPAAAAITPDRSVGEPDHGDQLEPASLDAIRGSSDGWQTVVRELLRSSPAPTETAEPADLDEEDIDRDERNALGVPVGLPAGLAATSIMAAGIVALIRWRRRSALRRRPETYRLPTPLTSTQTHLARLEAAAAPDETLDDIASLLASIPADTHPALVTLDDEGTVTLLFDDHAPLPEPPEPWTPATDPNDGPVGWAAKIGDRGPERSIGLPLLTTLGRTGQTTVFANVAALPTLEIVHDDSFEPRRLLRAMALEVATSRLAVPVEVVMVGDHLFDSLARVRRERDAQREVDAALQEIEEGVVPEDRTPRLIICREGTTPNLPETLQGTVGVIVLTASASGPWQIDAGDGTRGRLRLPDGGMVELTLPELDPWDLNHELGKLDRGAIPAEQDLHGAPAPVDPATQVMATSNGGEPVPVDQVLNGNAPAAESAGLRPGWCEIHLLGPTRVIRDGQPVDGITPKTLEVAAYLVTHRESLSKERLDDAVWAGRAGRPGSQRVTSALTKLREALGEGSDGELLIPRRSGAGFIRLSPHLGSDLDRAFRHVALARDLPVELKEPELAAALEPIRGEPFETMPVSWATDVIQRAIAQLQDAALELARIRRQNGDLDGAEDALRRGLRLLDPADALYLELAEVECARGRRDRVEGLWRQLCERHGNDADEITGLVSAPPPEIELAFRDLLAVG